MTYRTTRTFLATAFAVLLLLLPGAAAADPPTRVARLSFAAGAVAFSPGTSADVWVQARVNRPLVAGDRLWTDRNGRAELQLGTAVVRLASGTGMSVLNIDNGVTQLDVRQGVAIVRVRALGSDETFEIDTPNAALLVRTPGLYRIEVDANDGSTLVAVRDGEADVYGQSRAYRLEAGRWYRYYGDDLDSESARLARYDEFDRWADARDRRSAGGVSARYVSIATVGWEDLDEHGTWMSVPYYGQAWFPRVVPANWAPYRYGQWAWVEPWGWTWIDDAPWGFAPFHYGRWTVVENRWCWVPGRRDSRPVYAPALVGFIGSQEPVAYASRSAPVVAWFPLAPGEIYRPAYRASEYHVRQINVTNTVVNISAVTNVYANPEAARSMQYRNRQEVAAVTAVPAATFVGSQPVATSVVVVPPAMRHASVMPAPAVAPAMTSFTAPPATAAHVRPPSGVLERPVVAVTPPPRSPPRFMPAAGTAAAEVQQPVPSAAPAARVRVLSQAATPAQAGGANVDAGRVPLAVPVPPRAPPAGQQDQGAGQDRPWRDHSGRPASVAPPPASVPNVRSTVPTMPRLTEPVSPGNTLVRPPARPEPQGRPEWRGQGRERGADAPVQPATATVPPQPTAVPTHPAAVPTPPASVPAPRADLPAVRTAQPPVTLPELPAQPRRGPGRERPVDAVQAAPPTLVPPAAAPHVFDPAVPQSAPIERRSRGRDWPAELPSPPGLQGAPNISTRPITPTPRSSDTLSAGAAVPQAGPPDGRRRGRERGWPEGLAQPGSLPPAVPPPAAR